VSSVAVVFIAAATVFLLLHGERISARIRAHKEQQ
jgi:hypothetical protein